MAPNLRRDGWPERQLRAGNGPAALRAGLRPWQQTVFGAMCNRGATALVVAPAARCHRLSSSRGHRERIASQEERPTRTLVSAPMSGTRRAMPWVDGLASRSRAGAASRRRPAARRQSPPGSGLRSPDGVQGAARPSTNPRSSTPSRCSHVVTVWGQRVVHERPGPPSSSRGAPTRWVGQRPPLAASAAQCGRRPQMMQTTLREQK